MQRKTFSDNITYTFCKILKEGLNGLKMTYFSSRRDHYGYIDKTSEVKTPVYGPKQIIYNYDHCGINTSAIIMKHNESVGPNLSVRYKKIRFYK